MKFTLPLSGHTPRVLTGLVLAALLVTALVFRGLFLYFLLVAVTLAALLEFFLLFWPGKSKMCQKILGLVLGYAFLHVSSSDRAIMEIFPIWGAVHIQLIAILFFAFAVAAVSFLVDYGRGNDAARLEHHAILPLGLLYIPCSMSLAFSIPRVEVLWIVVAATAASDTFAYYAGCLFGKHKIWPRVSPKKSWEGSIGGFIGCTLVVVLLAGFFFRFGPAVGDTNGYRGWAWLGIGMLLNIAAQTGDFFESALKRTCNVKDSSTLLPGHGGVLDRIDSLLFVLPACWVAAMLIETCFHITLIP